MFLGAVLIAFSAVHLIPAILTGNMPQKWPQKPVSREATPLAYRISFVIFATIGLIGVILLFWSEFQQMSAVR